MIEVKTVKKDGYGYNVNNPIKVMGVMGTEYYFKSIASKTGIMIRWEREGSVDTSGGKILDKYAIFVLLPTDAIILRYIVYVDIYSIIDDNKAPEDFYIKI